YFQLDQIHLGHAALLEVANQRFLSQERLNREGWDATAATNRLEVRNGNWTLQTAPDATHPEAMDLHASVRAEAQFSLHLVPQKPLVVFGTNGVSRKAREPGAASHYLTYTRLAATGTVRVGAREAAVTGLAWMDHEFSSSQLGEDQVGWDWACLQLRDGREIMAYRMRRADGAIDPFSTLAWIDRQGTVRHVGAADFGWQSLGQWKSGATGAAYPAGILISATDPATGRPERFRLKPLAPNQELEGGLGGIPYWEGACQVLDESGKEIGQSFLELTGYAGSMKGKL
ncbi:MAG TPA: carotenoid 1,2-hydratase, partial [Verrucomicrobiae bacterium]